MSTPKTIRNTVMTTEIQKSDAEWRAELTPQQYDILRRKGTEAPFTGEYTYNHATGTYRCAACASELFGSDSKFDSGTGWPSFTEPAIAATVVVISAMCSPMGPARAESATASTRPLSRSSLRRTSVGETDPLAKRGQ